MTVSNLSFTASQYKNLQKLQAQLNKSVTEATNSRYADVGLSLGRLTGTAVNYRVQETSFQSQLQTNKVVNNRLDLINDALTAINKSATDFKANTIVAKKYPQFGELAKSGLQQLQGALNTADGGLYVFSGMNADDAPMPTIDTGLAAAKANYDAFVATVGRGSAQSINPTQMEQYLSEGGYNYTAPDGTVTNYSFFNTVKEPAWSANWSKASNNSTQASISKTETVETSVSANGDGIKKLVAGYSMLAVIDMTKLTDVAKDAVSRQAATTMTAGTDAVTSQQALVGMRQSRIDTVNKALTSQKDVAETAYSDLEGVDPYEASQRMNALELQLNAAMAATARIQKISILDYI